MSRTLRTTALASVLALVLTGCLPSPAEDNYEQQPDCPEGSYYDSGLEDCVPLEDTEEEAPPEAPSSSDTQFEQDTSAFQASGNQIGTVDYQATTDYLFGMVQHMDTIWSNWFRGDGYAEPWVNVILIQPGFEYTSKCDLGGTFTVGSAHPNAYYCPVDMNQSDGGTLIIPVETMGKMWSGNIFGTQVSDPVFVGDFAAGVILAHEFGHHIQDELGENSGDADPGSPNAELIADCFAGIWAYSLGVDSRLETGDIEEALNALAAIGDNTGSHGTSEERMNAFLIGYTGSQADPRPGVPRNCINAYWSAFSG